MVEKYYKFLILVAYYNRPKLVINLIKSINSINYPNFDVCFIDDGSFEGKKVLEVAQKYLNNPLICKTYFHYISDSPEQKIQQGGSRHGEYLNKTILESNSDLVMVVCDDDAIISDSLIKLNEWFIINKEKNYAYSHVRIFNSDVESPFGVEKRPHWTNLEGDIDPFCRVDSSQVVFKSSCFKEGGIRYPFPQTKDLDASLFKQLFEKYGPCPFTGFDIQYKNYFSHQLGKNSFVGQVVSTDID